MPSVRDMGPNEEVESVYLKVPRVLRVVPFDGRASNRRCNVEGDRHPSVWVRMLSDSIDDALDDDDVDSIVRVDRDRHRRSRRCALQSAVADAEEESNVAPHAPHGTSLRKPVAAHGDEPVVALRLEPRDCPAPWEELVISHPAGRGRR